MARSALVVALVCASAHAFAGPRANVGARVAMRSAADGGAAPAAPPTRNDTLTGAQLALMLSDVRTHYRKPFLDDPKSDAAAEEGADLGVEPSDVGARLRELGHRPVAPHSRLDRRRRARQRERACRLERDERARRLDEDLGSAAQPEVLVGSCRFY